MTTSGKARKPRAAADVADGSAPGPGPEAAAGPEAHPDTARSESAPPAMPDDVAALGYEQARDELVDVVRRLEQGGVTLEESLTLWERGEALAARCEQWLAGARQRLEAAVARSGRTTPAADES